MLYLAWLRCAQTGALEDETIEPPVPPGLRSLTAPLEAFAEFMCVDRDLLEAAAEASPDRGESLSHKDLERWIALLPDFEKAAALLKLATGNALHVQAELANRFRASRERATVSQVV